MDSHHEYKIIELELGQNGIDAYKCKLQRSKKTTFHRVCVLSSDNRNTGKSYLFHMIPDPYKIIE